MSAAAGRHALLPGVMVYALVLRSSTALNSPIVLPVPESDCRFLEGGIPIRGGIAAAREAVRLYRARAGWGKAKAPWYVPDSGRVRRMCYGALAAGAVTLAADMAMQQGCEPSR